MNALSGSHWLFYHTPVWASALILYVVTLGAMHIGREYFEGLPYQVAYSAQFGDAGLIGAVLIAATILQRGEVALPGWLINGYAHLFIAASSFFIGLVVSGLTIKLRSGQVMDIYHDAVIGPMFLYFAATLLPVIYLGGNTTEKAATGLFVVLWLALVVYDIKDDRMNQRKWLQRSGVVLRR
jgi:hypothetical protein